MKSHDIRSRFLQYFADRGHSIIPSASLVPANDPTVLFTTAGMHPLVPYLLGEPHPLGKRLANVQKCVRTDDIEEVGDNRHNTFFEMLGNWSLGDYFKKESLAWSFEFLTDKEKGLGLDPERLYVTVYAGSSDAPRDEESIAIWQDIFKRHGLSAEIDKPLSEGGRIFTLLDNWWGPAGQTGPCGPDSEMHYDTGRGELSLTTAEGLPDFESGRIVEIWNNVFMQFRKTEAGLFEPLAQNNVDTGMGLERITMVVQGVETIFDTDLFADLLTTIKTLSPQIAEDERAVRIVADHLRAAVFMISDGVIPSNKERGYILRRLLRRAILHLSLDSTEWVNTILEVLLKTYESAYPVLREERAQIVQAITDEATKFQRTLAKGKAEIAKRTNLTGKDAFDLYQSYGFPLELTKEYAQSQGVVIDKKEFQTEFERHQNLSRTASSGQFKSGLADHSEQTVQYHTATHLLHQALRDVLGGHVQQKGSNITPERLRFDFSHPEKLTAEQIAEVEARVNAQIKAALPVTVTTMNPEEAKRSGAIGLFNEKYGDAVTVYSIGGYSKEICTGPHVSNTSELGEFKISKEEAVSAGVRRIKAVLGPVS